MGLDTKEKEIDGMKIAVTQFPARSGFKLQAKLAGIFGPVIGEIIGGLNIKGKTKISEADIDFSKVSDALRVLFEKLDEERAYALVLEILQFTRADGHEINDNTFDQLFPGKYLTVYKTVGFTLEVNYGSFFGGSGIGQAFKKMMTQTQPMPPVDSVKK